MKALHENQGCNLQQSIRNSVAQSGIREGLMRVLLSSLVKKKIYPRNETYSLKRVTARSSQQHDNCERRLRLSHWPRTWLKRGNFFSFTYAFPFTSTHKKLQGIVIVPAGTFRCPIIFCCVLTGLNALKCSISYSGVDRLLQNTWRGDVPWVRRTPKRM